MEAHERQQGSSLFPLVAFLVILVAVAFSGPLTGSAEVEIDQAAIARHASYATTSRPAEGPRPASGVPEGTSATAPDNLEDRPGAASGGSIGYDASGAAAMLMLLAVLAGGA